MPVELAESLLSTYTLRAIAAEAWWAFGPLWAVVVVWLAARLWKLSRAPALAAKLAAARGAEDEDLLTLPTLAACAMGLVQFRMFTENAAHMSDAGFPAGGWITLAASAFGLFVVVALSSLSAVVARGVLGLDVPAWPRLAFPGIFAVASLFGLWILLFAVFHAWWLQSLVDEGAG